MKIYTFIIVLFLLSVNTIKSQEKAKDTLFFKLDGKYLSKSKDKESKLYIIKNNYDVREGAVYFKEYKVVKCTKPQEVFCFKKFAESAKLYRINNKKQLSELKIMNLFDNYIVVIVNKKDEEKKYVEVEPVFKIE
ncbi:hypothetical protein [Flavobacterium sp. 2]|uniref:hypothetical protein n=1 Tax=Flavobacterium sp. 2 TaxID=308053 RepID=UPI003CFAA1E1